MLAISWGLALAGLTAFFGSWEDKQHNPNQTIKVNDLGEVILQQNRQGHYIASGLINNQAVVFLLDTGATDVAIPSSLAKTLGLKPGRKNRAITANGVVDICDTRIESLQLGTIKLNNVHASILPGMTGTDILLGMSALKDLELTQRGATLTIKQIY